MSSFDGAEICEFFRNQFFRNRLRTDNETKTIYNYTTRSIKIDKKRPNVDSKETQKCYKIEVKKFSINK